MGAAKSATAAALAGKSSPIFFAASIDSGWGGPVCISIDTSDYTLADIVLDYVRTHPQLQHLVAIGLIGNALREVFPCQQ